MKNFITIITVIVAATIFTQCSASKNNKIVQIKPPFNVIKATYTSWVGGQPGIRGITVQVEIDNPNITLDSVYFRGLKSVLKIDKSTTMPIFVSSFVLPKKSKDFILDADPKKEYGNEPPRISTKFPFQLKKNEAVVSYFYKGKVRYFKIIELIEVN